jgi:hypothetical protein
MIHYLRAQLGKENCQITNNISRNIFLQSPTPIFRSNDIDLRPVDSMKNVNQSVASLESVFAAVMTEHERSKIVMSSIS